MQSRGLRSDIRRQNYAQILDADPPGAKAAIAGTRGRGALTTSDYVEQHRRKACKIFRGSGDVCERVRCGKPRDSHPTIWKQAAA